MPGDYALDAGQSGKQRLDALAYATAVADGIAPEHELAHLAAQLHRYAADPTTC